MLLKTSIAGILAVMVSLAFMFPLSNALTVDVPRVVIGDLIPATKALVGDAYEKSTSIEKGAKVTGTVQVRVAGGDSAGEIVFMVLDGSNHTRWLAGESFRALYKNTGSDLFDFFFTVERSGAHYFVFDNRASLYKKEVSFAAKYEQTVLSKEPDSRVRYFAYALLVAGIPVLGYGLIRRPQVRWA